MLDPKMQDISRIQQTPQLLHLQEQEKNSYNSTQSQKQTKDFHRQKDKLQNSSSFDVSIDEEQKEQHRQQCSSSSSSQFHQSQEQRQQQQSRSVSIFVYKTLNTVFKSSRRIIVRVCEVASAKKSLKMFNLYSSMKNRGDSGGGGSSTGLGATIERGPTTGHDRFCQMRLKDGPNRKKRNGKNVRRTNSANEFDITTLTAANKRQLFSRHRSASSEHDNSDHSEHSEKSPLVSTKLDSLARLIFSKNLPSDAGHRDTVESTLSRPNLKYQYTALDSGSSLPERSPRERAARDRALNACQEWVQNSNGRYDIIAHLDEIGSRHNKNWFLISDASVRTDRLMSLLPLPPDCVALEELPSCESPKGLLMELLSSLHHPYVYPVLDLGFLHTSESINYACLVMPFNPRGSLKDLIYKSQWNEPWNRKYTKKPTGLPLTQIQRLGRQILEALLFLKERGFPLHGHLHSGNVILQNGVARLTGLENSLLGLNSRVNAILWSRTAAELENIDILCFGHLLYEMCLGYELNSPQPSIDALEMDLEKHPQILEILLMIFDPPSGYYPAVEDLVLCDLFRNIELRELRGPCISTIKPYLSKSTINLLHAVKKRQTANLGESFSEISSPCTPPSTPRDRRPGTTDSFDISSDSECVLDEVIITSSSYESHHYDPLNSPIHFCDNSLQSDDNSSTITVSGATTSKAIDDVESTSSTNNPAASSSATILTAHAPKTKSGAIVESSAASALAGTVTGTTTGTTNSNGTTTSNQLTADMCNFKNSKNRRLEYSLRCLKYGRSNPSQDSAFGSLTDGELSVASSFRLSSFQSITSPIDEGVEDIILISSNKVGDESEYPTINSSSSTTSINNCNNELIAIGNLELNGRNVRQSNDSAISTPCRDGSPNFSSASSLIDDYSNKITHLSPAVSPKKLKSATSPTLSISPSGNSCCVNSNGTNCNVNPSISGSGNNVGETPTPSGLVSPSFQFDPPKILVNDQNSIYTTSPSKRSDTIEVFSQKYRVCSFEDMSPNRKNLRNVNKMAFRSLEEEKRIDSAFTPIKDRTNSENRVFPPITNTEKYNKLTHSSFSNRITNATEPSGSKTCTPANSSTTSIRAANDTDNDSNHSDTNDKSKPKAESTNHSGNSRGNRYTMWRDSIFYRKTKIAKSNDSLLEVASQQQKSKSSKSLIISRDNHELKKSSSSLISRGIDTVNEIFTSVSSSSLSMAYLNATLQEKTKNDNRQRQYTALSCSSALLNNTNTNDNNHLRVDDTRKCGSNKTASTCAGRSDRHFFSLSKLKQSAITDCFSDDESFVMINDNNRSSPSQSLNSSTQAISLNSTSANNVPIKSKLFNKSQELMDKEKQKQKLNLKESIISLAVNRDNNHYVESDNVESCSSDEENEVERPDEDDGENSSCHQDICKIIGGVSDPPSSSEEKTPLLESMEMSPISPTEPDMKL